MKYQHRNPLEVQAVAITAEMMKDRQHWECLQQDQQWGQLLSPAPDRAKPE